MSVKKNIANAVVLFIGVKAGNWLARQAIFNLHQYRDRAVHKNDRAWVKKVKDIRRIHNQKFSELDKANSDLIESLDKTENANLRYFEALTSLADFGVFIPDDKKSEWNKIIDHGLNIRG